VKNNDRTAGERSPASKLAGGKGMEEKEDTTIYKVVVNHEEQYSIWPVDKENALGWKDAGKSGTKAECLAYIKEVWTDMRPLSLRIRMSKSDVAK
jgi:MbtH protein